MVLFMILLIILIILAVFIVLAISAIGAGGIVIFGDVIVCIVFIILIMRFLINRKRKK